MTEYLWGGSSNPTHQLHIGYNRSFHHTNSGVTPYYAGRKVEIPFTLRKTDPSDLELTLESKFIRGLDAPNGSLVTDGKKYSIRVFQFQARDFTYYRDSNNPDISIFKKVEVMTTIIRDEAEIDINNSTVRIYRVKQTLPVFLVGDSGIGYYTIEIGHYPDIELDPAEDSYEEIALHSIELTSAAPGGFFVTEEKEASKSSENGNATFGPLYFNYTIGFNPSL